MGNVVPNWPPVSVANGSSYLDDDFELLFEPAARHTDGGVDGDVGDSERTPTAEPPRPGTGGHDTRATRLLTPTARQLITWADGPGVF